MHNDDPFEVNCLKAATEVLGTVDDVPKQKLARHWSSQHMIAWP